ncbi:MAG: hypothetical protein AAF791_04490 [Bacteroidota bacterium]
MSRETPRLLPRSRSDFARIRSRGLASWLTWATLEQAVGDVPLTWWQRLFRRVL